MTKKKNIINVFIDLETTGVDFNKNGIHQIAGLVEINSEVKETFDIKCRPFPEQEISPKALEICNISEETIMSYQEPQKAYDQLLSILSKYINKFDTTQKAFFIGYNSHFDNQFLRRFFANNHDRFFGSWFWSGTIDIMVLALKKLQNVRHEMKDFKLGTVAKQLGLEFDEEALHDALEDIVLTKNMYYKLEEM